MAIRIEHGRPETLLTVAQMKGEERAAQQQLEITERLQAQQREFEYRTAIRQQDMAIDLQMQERAKTWEIEKMELRSRMDFQREEQKRQRIIDDAENATLQIEKEIKAGNIDKDDLQVKNLLLYYSLQSQFPDKSPPTGLLKTPVKREDAMDVLLREYLEDKLIGTAGEEISITGQEPIYIRNPATGERQVSYDSGETWQPVGKEVAEKPTARKPKLKPYGTVYREWL